MKKVLALVLAVMMMATVAFAAVTVNVDGGIVVPSKKININRAPLDSGDVDTVKDVNSENYSITGIKYTEGRNLVESVKFNDDEDRVEVKIKAAYDLTKEKNLEMEFTLKGKKVGNTKPTDVTVKINATVANEKLIKAFENNHDTITLTSDDPEVQEGKIVEIEKSDDGETSYGTLSLTAADSDVEVEVRVYDGDKLYLYSEVDADTDILKAYADTDADITFLTFKGKPTFNATATVRFFKEEGTYIYANNDGKLSRITAASAGSAGQTAGNVKWDEDEGCYILKARTLGSYVFSDKPLKVSATSDGTDAGTANPDTGANDVVGVATALAAVALVSAAAVSLKK